MLYKVVYDIISEYANLIKLNDFLEYGKKLIYKCDDCDCQFYYVKPQNTMMYELVLFDNNLLHDQLNKYEMKIGDYITLSGINLKMCKYFALILIFMF